MSKLLFKFSFLVLLICSANFFPALSQEDSTPEKKEFFVDAWKIPFGAHPFSHTKTDSITFSSVFYNKVEQEHIFLPGPGNLGSASYNIFSDFSDGKYFNDGFDQFDLYLLQPEKKILGSAARRFTNINYHLGSKKEQHIFIRHEQKFKEWLIAGLDFGALSSPGDFSRQLNTNRSFDIFFAIETPSRDYRMFISFTSNRVLNQENGGITVDSIFENATTLDTKTLPVNLLFSSVRQRSRDYVLKQELNLSEIFSKKDSTDKIENFNQGSLVLNHTFWWHRKSMLFTSGDSDSNYYQNTYFDTTLSYDSSFYSDLYNKAVIEYATNPDNAKRVYSFGAGMDHQVIDYFTTVVDTELTAMNALFYAGFNTPRFMLKFSFSKALSGDYSEGYKGFLNFDYRLNNNKDRIYFNVALLKTTPSLKELLYVSNHFIWKNDLEMPGRLDVSSGINISDLKLNIEGKFSVLQNLIFYREDFLPQTFSDQIAIAEISLSKSFSFGKFGIDEKLKISNSGNENVVSLPLLINYAAIYYQNDLFKKALGLKIGFDVNYFSSYYGYGYMPATGTFYIQNEKKVGNYPRIGLFAKLKIQTAQLFLKLEHFNAGLIDRTYYGAYRYPLPGRAFKFGVIWDLVD